MYNRNPNLRGPHEKIRMSAKRLQEYIRCKEDVMYFAENYFYIVSQNEGRIKIPLYNYQKKMLKAFTEPTKNRKHCIVNSSRQIGKTTIATVFLLHYALFNEDKTIAIQANKEKVAIGILARIKLAYAELPLWMQQGIDEENGGWAKSSIGLESGVKIIAGSTASNALRSDVVSLLFLDEFGHVPDNIADDFMMSVYPTIVTGDKAKIIIVSTPNGLNHFYNVWRKSVRGENNFMPIKINWDDVPGRNKKWKEMILKDLSPQEFAQEFGCKFLGSSNTLIDTSLLERMNLKSPVELKLGSYLSVYEQPQEGAMYMLGVDSAKGTGRDYSVIQVLKINSEHDIEQAAVYRNNVIEARDFAQVVIAVSQFYNDCYIMLENNDVGETVGNTIWYEYEYDKILNCDPKGIGIKSTKKTKLAGNILLKRYVENGWMEIIDRHTLYELSRYEEVTPNVFKAPRGQNDDCVTSLIWGLYFVTTLFFDGKNVDVKTIDDKFKLDKHEDDCESPIFVDDTEDHLEEGWGFDEGLEGDSDYMY